MDNEPDPSVTTHERLLGYSAAVVIIFVVIVLAVIIGVKIQQKKQMSDYISRQDAWRAAASTNDVNNPFPKTILDTNSDAPANSISPMPGSYGLETNSN